MLLFRVKSPLLDVENPFDGAYTLEVSSPGTDRLLEVQKDFTDLRTFLFASNPKIENQRSMVFYDRVTKTHLLSRSHPYKKSRRNNKKMQLLKTIKISKIVMRTFQYSDVNWVRLHPTDEELTDLPNWFVPRRIVYNYIHKKIKPTITLYFITTSYKEIL